MWIGNNMGPKMDPCGTLQDIFPKSDSLFSIFARNILGKRYDLNHLTVPSENLIALICCNKILWSIVSKACVKPFQNFIC